MQAGENKKAASRNQAAVKDLKESNESLKAALAHSERERSINLERLAKDSTQLQELLVGLCPRLSAAV